MSPLGTGTLLWNKHRRRFGGIVVVASVASGASCSSHQSVNYECEYAPSGTGGISSDVIVKPVGHGGSSSTICIDDTLPDASQPDDASTVVTDGGTSQVLPGMCPLIAPQVPTYYAGAPGSPCPSHRPSMASPLTCCPKELVGAVQCVYPYTDGKDAGPEIEDENVCICEGVGGTSPTFWACSITPCTLGTSTCPTGPGPVGPICRRPSISVDFGRSSRVGCLRAKSTENALSRL